MTIAAINAREGLSGSRVLRTRRKTKGYAAPARQDAQLRESDQSIGSRDLFSRFLRANEFARPRQRWIAALQIA